MSVATNTPKQFGASLRICLLLSILGCSFLAHSQRQAAVLLDRNPVVAGQGFRLTFEFRDANVPFSNPPSIEGLRYLNGPSTSTNTQFVNGSMSTKRSYTYTVVASKTGRIQIPSLEFKAQGGTLRTEPVVLQVVAKGTGNQGAASPFDAVIEVNKRSAHIGEPIMVQYRIFNTLEAVDVRNYTFPELSGVWKETVEGEDPRWETTIVEGRRVQVATVRTDILYPTQTGTLEIVGFDVDAQQRVGFFNTRPISSSADAVAIEVKPLPDPAPANSLGTFESLTATWKYEGKEAPTTNEAINLVLEFKGKGNLPLIGAPEINWPKDLEVFDPEIQDRITTDSKGQRGRRTMTYLVIPRSPGAFEVDPPEMQYFDCALDRFVTLDTRSIQWEVTGPSDEQGPSFGFNSKTDVTILTRDMRFIRTETELKPRSTPFFGGILHMGLWAFPPLMLLFGAVRKRRMEKEEANPNLVRRKTAKAQLKSALSDARSGKGSFDDLGEAAHAFIQSHLGIPRSDASLDRYRQAMQHEDEAFVDQWIGLLSTLDRGRFAPGAPDMTEVAGILENAAHELERKNIQPSNQAGSAILWVLGILLSGQTMWAAPDASAASERFNTGNAAYLEGDLDGAIQHYEEVAEQWTSFELEYNLGVAHYKSGRIGPSILHFERARRIRPSDDDLQANLLLAKSAVVDRIEELPEIALAPLWRELTAQHRLSAWTIGAIILWFVAFLLLFLRMSIRDVATRRLLIILGPVLCCSALSLGFLSRATFLRSQSDQGAVIMAPRIEVKSSPSDGVESSDLFVIHEGTVVEIIRSESGWYQIQLANGNTGWIHAPALAPI